MSMGLQGENIKGFLPDRSLFGLCSSWFDLFGRCCDIVDQAFPDHALLLKMYSMEAVPGGVENPNIETMKLLENTVCDFAADKWLDCDELDQQLGKTPLEHVLDVAYQAAIDLKEYGDERLNRLVPWHFVARGIDRAAGQIVFVSQETTSNQHMHELGWQTLGRKAEQPTRQESLGPYNNDAKSANGDFGVYAKPRFSVVESISLENGLDRIPDCALNDAFSTLMFYRAEGAVRTLPNMLLLPRPRLWSPPAETQLIQIGIAAFSRNETVGIIGSDNDIWVCPSAGESFVIKYSENYAEKNVGKIIFAIDRAIQLNCHVLIFPEMVVPKELVNAASDYLRSLDGNHTLALIVMGSGWVSRTNAQVATESNVCHLLDAYGESAGEYHKRERFHYSVSGDELLQARRYLEADDVSTSAASVAASCSASIDSKQVNPETETNVKMVELIEGLTDPGSEITVPVIPDFGAILPLICMDYVSNDGYAANLAYSFKPQLICCPALSRSLDRGFSMPVNQMLERFLAASCVCDLCGSRGDLQNRESIPIGIVAAPGFGNQDMQTSKKPVTVIKETERTRGCEESCSEENGCIFIAEINYAKESDDGTKPLITINGPFTST